MRVQKKSSACKPGKHPIGRLVPNGFQGRDHRHVAIVSQWWTKYPSANIAIATGAPSGVWLVDIDRHGEVDGEATLSALEVENGKLPTTLTARTGGGGRHLYFKYDPAVPITSDEGKSRNRPGVDIRGDNGYAVAPPSVHASGKTYEWENALAAAEPAPPWLIEVAVRGVRRDATAGPEEKPKAKRTKKPHTFFGRVNAAALANIAAWAPAIFPTGKFSSKGAFRVSSKSLGRDLEEDFSIHPGWCPGLRKPKRKHSRPSMH